MERECSVGKWLLKSQDRSEGFPNVGSKLDCKAGDTEFKARKITGEGPPSGGGVVESFVRRAPTRVNEPAYEGIEAISNYFDDNKVQRWTECVVGRFTGSPQREAAKIPQLSTIRNLDETTWHKRGEAEM